MKNRSPEERIAQADSFMKELREKAQKLRFAPGGRPNMIYHIHADSPAKTTIGWKLDKQGRVSTFLAWRGSERPEYFEPKTAARVIAEHPLSKESVYGVTETRVPFLQALLSDIALHPKIKRAADEKTRSHNQEIIDTLRQAVQKAGLALPPGPE